MGCVPWLPIQVVSVPRTKMSRLGPIKGRPLPWNGVVLDLQTLRAASPAMRHGGGSPGNCTKLESIRIEKPCPNDFWRTSDRLCSVPAHVKQIKKCAISDGCAGTKSPA